MHFCLPRSRHTSFCPGRPLEFRVLALTLLFIRAFASCLFSSQSWVFARLAKVQEHGLGAPCSVLRSLSLVSPRPSLSDNHTLCHRHSQMTRHSVLPSLPPPAFVSRRSISSWEYRKKYPMLSVSSFRLFHSTRYTSSSIRFLDRLNDISFSATHTRRRCDFRHFEPDEISLPTGHATRQFLGIPPEGLRVACT